MRRQQYLQAAAGRFQRAAVYGKTAKLCLQTTKSGVDFLNI